MEADLRNKIRNSLSHIWDKQFLIFLFFVLLSSAFWIFTELNEEYQEEFSVPIELVGVPDNIVITTEPPAAITFFVHDRGGALLSYKLAKRLKPVIIDFNAYTDQGGHVSIPVTELAKQISSQFSASAQVSGLRPQQVEFYFNSGERKRVPVGLLGSIDAAERSYVSSVSLYPDSVTVFARRDILDTITTAYTQRIFLSGLADTLRQQIPLSAIPGVKFSPAQVELAVQVDRLVEKSVEVPVQQVNFPATKQLRTFPAKVKIFFQVGMSNYRKITPESFVLVVNYEELISSNSRRCPLSLKSVPAGVLHPRIQPAEVDYVIEEIESE